MPTSQQVLNGLKKATGMTYTVPAGAYSGGLYDSNPYRNLTYNLSPWQRLMKGLGFNTSADDWLRQMTTQANEYDAAIAEKMNDRQYDSASAQNQRMKAAGINPDINGGEGISPGDSGPAAEGVMDSDAPRSEDMQQFADVVSTSLSVVTSAFSGVIPLASGIQGLFKNSEEIKGMRNANTESSMGAFKDFIGSIFGGFRPGSAEDDFSAGVSNFFEAFSGRKLSEKQKSAYNQFARHYIDTLPFRAEQYASENKLFGEKYQAEVNRRSKYNEDNYPIDKDVFDSAFAVMADMEDVIRENEAKLRKALASRNIKQAASDERYLDTFNPETAAQSANALNAAGLAQAGYERDYYNTADGRLAGQTANFQEELAGYAAKMQRDIQSVIDRHADQLIKSDSWVKKAFGYSMKVAGIQLFTNIQTPLKPSFESRNSSFANQQTGEFKDLRSFHLGF